MANTAIQNIKILHKRYSTDQWTNGFPLNGKTQIPTLAQGEIGLDTTTLEVRIGTNSTTEQTWSQAHVIDAEVIRAATYYHADGSYGNAPKSGENYVVTDVIVENTTEGKHKLSITYKEIGLIAPIPDLVVTDGTATATDGEVVVVTGISEGAEHEVVSTKATAATKNYVDTRNLTIIDNDAGMFITDISESNANGNHTITVTRGDAVIDIPELELVDNTTGDYVSGISVDDHTITVTKGSLPVGSGSVTAGDLEFVDSVKLEGHTLSGTKKGIKGDGNVISVAKDTDGKIKISADTYTKAEIDEAHNNLAKAMHFEGTLANGDALQAASTTNKGAVYKVSEAGSVTVNGVAQAVKVGDLFISDGIVWRYVPAGDETFTDTWRNITINNGATTVKDNSIGGGAIDFAGGAAMSVTAKDGTITIAHNDTSDVEDLTGEARTYVTALTFDEYGHVTGYDVATESDQALPTVSGGETAGALELISKAAITNDGINYKLETDTKTLSGDTHRIDVSESNGTITVAHKQITTTATNATNNTITAGSTNNSFTVVDSIVNDGYGHVTDVKTKTVTVEVPQDTDTTYDLSATQSSTATGATSVDINLTASGSGSGTDKVNFKVDAATTAPVDGLQVTVSGDSITLTGKATHELLGLIRAAYNLNDTASTNVADSYLKNYTGNNMDKLYGVNVRKDGTAFVEVPWTDTNTHVIAERAGGAVTPADLYAFDTDSYGHINNVYAVTTLDGNYA